MSPGGFFAADANINCELEGIDQAALVDSMVSGNSQAPDPGAGTDPLPLENGNGSQRSGRRKRKAGQLAITDKPPDFGLHKILKPPVGPGRANKCNIFSQNP